MSNTISQVKPKTKDYVSFFANNTRQTSTITKKCDLTTSKGKCFKTDYCIYFCSVP